MIIGISKERLEHLLNNHDELIRLCPYAPEARGLIDNLIKYECVDLSNPGQTHEDALINDSTYAEAYNKGFSDGVGSVGTGFLP